MPDIKVKPNQLIEYLIPFDENSRFYCDDINSGIVIVSRNEKLRRLIIAHCEPSLKFINAFLIQCGLVIESGDPDSTWYLACGPKCNQELLRKITSVLETENVKFKIFDIKTNLLIEVGGDGAFLVKDQPQDDDKYDFADFTVNNIRDIKDYLADFAVIDTGVQIKDKFKASMRQTFQREDDSDSFEMKSINLEKAKKSSESDSSDGAIVEVDSFINVAEAEVAADGGNKSRPSSAKPFRHKTFVTVSKSKKASCCGVEYHQGAPSLRHEELANAPG